MKLSYRILMVIYSILRLQVAIIQMDIKSKKKNINSKLIRYINKNTQLRRNLPNNRLRRVKDIFLQSLINKYWHFCKEQSIKQDSSMIDMSVVNSKRWRNVLIYILVWNPCFANGKMLELQGKENHLTWRVVVIGLYNKMNIQLCQLWKLRS